MRIISGSAKGRKIETIEGLDTRPTLDRVKEAIFGSVQFDLPGSTVLDLFSGSGALGLEAASRGAANVYCNDISRACTVVIQKNAASTNLSEKIHIMNMDYRNAIALFAERNIRFGLAFLDAPYEGGLAQDAAEQLFGRRLILPGGKVILEHAWALPPHGVEGLMVPLKVKKFGTCGYTVFAEDSLK